MTAGTTPKPQTAARSARRARARVAHWFTHAAAQALRLGAGPSELALLATVADALRQHAAR